MRRSTNGGMRIVPAERVLETIPRDARRVGLVGAAVSDHPKIVSIVEALADRGCEVGLSSLRPDRLANTEGFVAALGARRLPHAHDRDGRHERARARHPRPPRAAEAPLAVRRAREEARDGPAQALLDDRHPRRDRRRRRRVRRLHRRALAHRARSRSGSPRSARSATPPSTPRRSRASASSRTASIGCDGACAGGSTSGRRARAGPGSSTCSRRAARPRAWPSSMPWPRAARSGPTSGRSAQSSGRLAESFPSPWTRRSLRRRMARPSAARRAGLLRIRRPRGHALSSSGRAARVSSSSSSVRSFPARFRRYFEPFAGGAALFFSLRPRRALLADVNAELIDCYIAARDEVDALIEALGRYRYGAEDYYRTRAIDRTSLPLAERAARTIYLNKTGYNGLYRVNRAGKFNVPMGRYSNPLVCDAANLRACSKALEGVDLRVADFEAIASRAKAGRLRLLRPALRPGLGHRGLHVVRAWRLRARPAAPPRPGLREAGRAAASTQCSRTRTPPPSASSTAGSVSTRCSPPGTSTRGARGAERSARSSSPASRRPRPARQGERERARPRWRVGVVV